MNTQDAIKSLDTLIGIVGESPGLSRGREALVQISQAEHRLATLSEETEAAEQRLSKAQADLQESETEFQRRVAAQAEVEREQVEKTAWHSAEARLVEQRLARAKAGLADFQQHAFVGNPRSGKRMWTLDAYVAGAAPQIEAELVVKDPSLDPQSCADLAREKARAVWHRMAAFALEVVAEQQEAKELAAAKKKIDDANAASFAAARR